MFYHINLIHFRKYMSALNFKVVECSNNESIQVLWKRSSVFGNTCIANLQSVCIDAFLISHQTRLVLKSEKVCFSVSFTSEFYIWKLLNGLNTWFVNLHWPHDSITIHLSTIWMQNNSWCINASTMRCRCTDFLHHSTVHMTTFSLINTSILINLNSPFYLDNAVRSYTLFTTYWFSICGAVHPVKTMHQCKAWRDILWHCGG